MSIREEARQEAAEYARRHVGGMQPVETVGDNVRAAFEAGAVWSREQDTREPNERNVSGLAGGFQSEAESESVPSMPSDAEVLSEIRATVERYWDDFEQADKWVDPDGRRAQVFARLGNTLDRILDGTPEPHHGPDDLRAVAARAERDSYESYADRSRTIRVLTSAARRLADVIEHAERIAGSNRAESTYVPERVRHADALATLAIARGDTTKHENRSE